MNFVKTIYEQNCVKTILFNSRASMSSTRKTVWNNTAGLPSFDSSRNFSRTFRPNFCMKLVAESVSVYPPEVQLAFSSFFERRSNRLSRHQSLAFVVLSLSSLFCVFLPFLSPLCRSGYFLFGTRHRRWVIPFPPFHRLSAPSFGLAW